MSNLSKQQRPHGMEARMAVNHARNTGRASNSWQIFQALNTAAYEVRRALWGIDGPLKAAIGDFLAKDK